MKIKFNQVAVALLLAASLVGSTQAGSRPVLTRQRASDNLERAFQRQGPLTDADADDALVDTPPASLPLTRQDAYVGGSTPAGRPVLIRQKRASDNLERAFQRQGHLTDADAADASVDTPPPASLPLTRQNAYVGGSAPAVGRATLTRTKAGVWNDKGKELYVQPGEVGRHIGPKHSSTPPPASLPLTRQDAYVGGSAPVVGRATLTRIKAGVWNDKGKESYVESDEEGRDIEPIVQDPAVDYPEEDDADMDAADAADADVEDAD